MNYTKLLAEKKNPARGKININSNVKIEDVAKASLTMGSSKQDVLRFSFEFRVVYEPDIGEILIKGDVLDLQKDAKTVENVETEWKKNKKIPKEIRNTILNHILNKCNIQAILMSKDINFPPPVPMPKVVPKGKQ